jgi:CDP-diacylglycerol--glycerol-3-phosphate 3-phosphatidyltransferase
MIEGLKPFYNNVLRPIARGLIRLHVHPNALTLLGVALFGGAAVLVARDHWLWALIVVIVASCLDGLDGLVAREAGLGSTFGAILDSTCDRVTEIFLLGGLTFYYSVVVRSDAGVWLSVAAVTGSLMVSYVKARCEGAGVACNAGILQRPERIVLLCAFLLLGPRPMVWGLALVALLSWATTVQRMFVAYRATTRH